MGATSGITSDYYMKVCWYMCCVFPVNVWHIDGTNNERSEMRGTAKVARFHDSGGHIMNGCYGNRVIGQYLYSMPAPSAAPDSRG